MIGYIYITTNKINGKQYIGKRQSSKFDTKYFGSGKILGQAIKKEGIENFICEVLEWCETVEDLNAKEIYYITQYDAVNSDKFYNLAAGGTGGNTGVDYAKMASSRNQSEEERQKRSASLKKAYEEGRHKIIRAGYPKGKKRSEKDIAANKERNQNKIWVCNGVEEIKIDVELVDKYVDIGYIPHTRLKGKHEAWNKGKTKETDIRLQKISEDRKEKMKEGPIGCYGLSGSLNYNHKDNTKKSS